VVLKEDGTIPSKTSIRVDAIPLAQLNRAIARFHEDGYQVTFDAEVRELHLSQDSAQQPITNTIIEKAFNQPIPMAA